MPWEESVKGTPFGQYRLIDMLGRGGMGEVWRAYDTATDRVVALKLLPSHYAADAVFKKRFRREAHAAARLSEPHVVPIHTYGEIERRLFVDMRLINGRDLHTLVAAGPPEPVRAVLIIEQTAKALQAVHHAGVVHRDVKPSNILVTDDDFAYLIDFGIARATGEAGSTTTGGVIGTLHYMAPERFTKGPVDARSDVYSPACVLYECLTGSYPFPGDSVEQQLADHLTTPPPQPSHSRPVPIAFDDVIAKGMAKDPGERYATTVELARAAREALGTSTSSHQPKASDVTPNLFPPERTQDDAPVTIGRATGQDPSDAINPAAAGVILGADRYLARQVRPGRSQRRGRGGAGRTARRWRYPHHSLDDSRAGFRLHRPDS
jgi:serine/threonine protein kinase, bacterial